MTISYLCDRQAVRRKLKRDRAHKKSVHFLI